MSETSDFETRRQLLQMEMLYEIGVALSESLDPAQVAEEVLQRAIVMVDARAALLLRRDPAGLFEVVGQEGVHADPGPILKLGELELAWTERRLVHLEGRAGEWQHLCIVPLESHQEVGGLLVMADRETRDGVGPFQENDEALLHSFAYQAGAALYNARLHRNLGDAYEQLKQAQRRLAQMEQLRALGNLAAEMVHAMSHVLGIIVGRADMYLSFRKDPERAMESILQTAENGQEIIDRIRQITQLSVGRKREKANLAELVRQAVDNVQALWTERRGAGVDPVEWALDLRGPEEVLLNRADVGDALQNLLLNALEAMPEGGRLQVGCWQQGEQAVVQVRDSGTGMSEQVRKRLFEPFFSTKGEVGNGLGLCIVMRVIADHGGEVEVESVEGEGSTFRLRWPLKPLQRTEEGDEQAGPDR